MNQIKKILMTTLLVASCAFANDEPEVMYLGNTALLVSHGQTQVLFDPFFHQHFGQYQLVPEKFRSAIFKGEGAFDSVDVVFISHAHDDHFDAIDLMRYLESHDQVKLVAPRQAVNELEAMENYKVVADRIHAIDLNLGDQPESFNLNGVDVDVVRIPHAGWPKRAHVSNLVYRVTLDESVTVMHMGDADPNDEHFKPWKDHWQAQITDETYPPYWFMLTESGQRILAERINTKNAVGVHVPEPLTKSLSNSSSKYFNQPGQKHTIQLKAHQLKTQEN